MFKKSFKVLCLVIMAAMFLASCSGKAKVDRNANVEETKINVSKGAAPVLENELFKVEVPAKFDGTYETEVNDHTINFFDKAQLAAGNGGWLFGIQLFENPNDWAGGPTMKFGEITLNNGKLYDVIFSFPTESQFGFSTDGSAVEMPTQYKAFYDSREEIAATLTGKEGEKVVAGAGTKGETLYSNEIYKHLRALAEAWDATKLESEDMSTMYAVMKESEADNIYSKVAFAYIDINLDGIDELLIGEIAEGEWNGIIYDLYTMVDRKPAHVVSGWDRNRYFALDGTMIRNEYSNGANESGVNIYTLTNNSTELFKQLAYKYDGYTNEKKPWFSAHDFNKEGEANWENIEESSYNELDARFSKKAKIDYVPFSIFR